MEEPPLISEEDAHLRSLMVRYQGGDLPAFEEFYRLTAPMIRGYLRALTRDAALTADLVQEAYLQVHRSRRTYDPNQPVRPWMIAIARHVRLTEYRVRSRLSSREISGLDALPEASVPPEVASLADRDLLGRALAALAPDRREAVVLHHIYGLSFREVSRIVGVSEGGARIRASRGMAELRALLPAKERP